MSGIKTASKYGGPTEILPMSSASNNNGYKVPSNTAAAATINKTLLVSNADSREIKLKRPPIPTFGARQANNVSEIPIVNNNKNKINTPRSGSVANACTEVNTPERTRKVPNKLNENAKIANNTVQFLKVPRFSVTASE